MSHQLGCPPQLPVADVLDSSDDHGVVQKVRRCDVSATSAHVDVAGISERPFLKRNSGFVSS